MTPESIQILRFRPEVKLEGFTAESARSFLRSYGENPNMPHTTAFLEQELASMSEEALMGMLRALAYQQFLSHIAPIFAGVIKSFRDHPFPSFGEHDAFCTAYGTSQDAVDLLLAKGKAEIGTGGALCVEDADLAEVVFGIILRLKTTLDEATSSEALDRAKDLDDRGRTTAQLLIYLMESFRHPVTWKWLWDNERSAIHGPCMRAVLEMTGSRAQLHVRRWIPWPFAFILWSSRGANNSVPAWARG